MGASALPDIYAHAQGPSPEGNEYISGKAQVPMGLTQ